MKRQGLGKGLGMGYKNLIPIDSHIHSLSAKGISKKKFHTYDINSPINFGTPPHEKYGSDEGGFDIIKIGKVKRLWTNPEVYTGNVFGRNMKTLWVNEKVIDDYGHYKPKLDAKHTFDDEEGKNTYSVWLTGKVADSFIDVKADNEKEAEAKARLMLNKGNRDAELRKIRKISAKSSLNAQFVKKFNTAHSIAMAERGRTIHFQSRENRDSVMKELKRKGYDVKRSTSKGQLLHPEYVEDYEGEVDTGFGNMMYKTMFPILYNLEIKER